LATFNQLAFSGDRTSAVTSCPALQRLVDDETAGTAGGSKNQYLRSGSLDAIVREIIHKCLLE
jgi:hypothetical protein